MASEVKSDKSKVSVKTILGYLGWVIIYTGIVLGVGFYLGSESQVKAQADTKKAVESAVKAAAPAPVVEVPK